MAFLDAFRVLLPVGWKGKKPRRKGKAVRQRGAGAFVPGDVAAEHGAVRVLVADLHGPGGREAAEQIAAVLIEAGGIDVYRRAAPLKQPNLATLLDRLSAAAEEGRAWLKQEDCELLVWGEVEGEGGPHRLRWLAASPAAVGMGLGDSLVVPAAAGETGAALIAASALAAAGPSHRGLRAPLLQRLQALLERLDGMAEAPIPGFDAAQQTSAIVAVGNAHAAAAQMGGGGAALARALAAFLAAAERLKGGPEPLDHALALSHAAAVLELQGRKAKDAAPLEQAAQLYRDAADALGRGEHPADWGLAHVRLGMVLYRLAGIDLARIAQHLKAASATFEEALTAYDRHASPGRWAAVMNHYGITLLALGEQVTGNVTLEQAIAAFKKSLEVRKREHAPLLWAQTANNLGAASFALAKRTGAAEALREAAGYFEASAGEFRKHPGYGKRAEVIEKNLGRVQRLLETRRVG